MLAVLSAADTVTWMSILVKALTYAATLSAAGSVLIGFALRELSDDGRMSLRRIAVASAVAAALLSLLLLPLRASFLMGGTLDGAMDPMILGMVAESPLGTSLVLRLIGLALILCMILPVRVGHWFALAGACLAAASFAMRGHALGEPRALLGLLVTAHILGLAFWIGAFAPLARSARTEPPERAGALAHEFGRQALWVVAVLVAAGATILALFGAATPLALSTAYGQLFAVKLAVFAGVLALAAANKLSLTPALRGGEQSARTRLRRSIRRETALVAVILLTTAALTTLTSPPSGSMGAHASTAEPFLRLLEGSL